MLICKCFCFRTKTLCSHKAKRLPTCSSQTQKKKEWWRCSQWHWQHATGSDWGIGCHVGGRTRLGRVILSRFTKESGMNKNYDVIRVIYSMNFDSLFIFQVQILWTVFIYYHLLYSVKTYDFISINCLLWFHWIYHVADFK